MGNAYFLVVLGILLAKGVGFWRDMVFAEVFGTSVGADIYFQVFGLVNLIFTGIGVALSTLIIKNINKSHNNGREREYASSFLTKSIICLVLSVCVMALFAKQIVSVILPGISGADFDLAVKMVYVMLPSLVFVVVAYIVSGILQNEKSYFITSIMSLPFNAIIILTLLIKNVSIFTISIVTTIGWFLQILTMTPSFLRKRYSFFGMGRNLRKTDGKNPEIIWIFISNMMFQLCFYIDRAFVSGDAGMAATFNYASNLFITIASVFVVAMSTVVFPAISKNYEEGNVFYVNDLLRYIITIMVAIFLPFLLVISLFGPDVIRLIYERGSFTSESTKAVSTMFLVYSLGILGYVSQELFNKILYLAGKYKYTVIGTVAVVIVNVITNLVIISSKSVMNIPLVIASTTSVFLTVYAVVIAFGIKKVVGPYWKKDLISDLIKIFMSAVLAFLTYMVFNTFLSEFTHGYLTFVVVLGVCGFVYLVSLYFTGVLTKLIKREKKEQEE